MYGSHYLIEHMEENIENYLPTLMFRWSPIYIQGGVIFLKFHHRTIAIVSSYVKKNFKNNYFYDTFWMEVIFVS